MRISDWSSDVCSSDLLPLPTSGGHQFDLSVGVRGDIYSVDDVIVDGESRDGIVARLVPEAVASWRYPLVRTTETTTQILEPMAMIALAPNDVNPDRIPNEESSNFELDDMHLFETNRFPGHNRVRGGKRAPNSWERRRGGERGGGKGRS